MWGQELEEPLIALTNIPLKENTISFLGSNGKTLRINLDGKKTNLIKFNISDNFKDEVNPDGGILYATVIGKCDLNHYMGNVTP